jgi:NitT/TauT family transport system substrate-binding protein
MKINAILQNTLQSLLICLLACFCWSSCSNKPSDVIRIGILEGPSAVSFIQLIDQAPIIQGKRIEIILKSEPMQIQALMMQNKLDFAILPTVMAANLYNKGLKYRMVACPIWGTLYLLTNGTEKKIDDLQGKAISVFGQGATSDILVRRLLVQKGLNNVKIDYTYTTNQEISQALLFRKTSLAVVSEPMVSNLMAQDPTIRIVSKIDCEEYMNNSDVDIFVQTSFLVNDRFITDYPELVSKVCEVYSASCNFTYEQPENAAKLLVAHGLYPNVDIAKRSIPYCNIQYVAAFALEREVNRYLTIFYESNPESIGGKLPSTDFIYQTY